MKSKLLGVMLLISMNAYAGSTTGSLYLAGEIPVVTTIQVDALPGSTNLDLLDSQSNLNVASVIEQNNTRRGYFVTLSSKNGGNFELEDSHRAKWFNKIPYSAQYNGIPVKLDRHERVIYRSAWHNMTAQERDVNFSISYEGQDPTTKLAGKYSDTLTFQIVAR